MTQMIRSAFARPAAQRVRLGALYALWRERQQLAKLDDRALADIGVTRTAADAEAARPFWDAPTHWHS